MPRQEDAAANGGGKPADVDTTRKPDTSPVLTAEEARQGNIVLNTRLRRIVFFGGLAALVLFCLLITLYTI